MLYHSNDNLEDQTGFDLAAERDEELGRDAETRTNLCLLRGGGAQASLSEIAQSHKLEALKVLTLALFREVEALSRTPAQGAENRINLSEEVRRFESDLILSALIRTGGRQRQAARLLGMKVTTLHTKIRRYRIDADEIARGAVRDRALR
ncbi:MAG TPA: helix-turn-helix domain-containing protein [Pyrinomonadaceae bacterium]|nr:helix-turn-helix domain-containing protein [Pyrinomonadaceae bacterium]